MSEAVTLDRHKCRKHNEGSKLGRTGVCLHANRHEHGDTQGCGWLLSWREP